MKGLTLSTEQANFLARFEARGWLHADREDVTERAAVITAIRKGWLRQEGSEAHFTPAGRRNLARPAPGAPSIPPRTPEDGQTVVTPEQGRPIATRKDPA